MSEKKYFFLGTETEDIRFLYADFNKGKSRVGVFPTGGFRKACKFFEGYGFEVIPYSYISYRGYETYIGKKIKNKGWKRNDEIIFVIYGRSVEAYGKGLVKYLRLNYTKCKLIAYFGDLLGRHKIPSIDSIKRSYDAVLTCDTTEAEKYGMYWCMEPFSVTYLKSMALERLQTKWDVTFVGHAKDRYEQIIELYEALRERGFLCDFHITGVSKDRQKYKREIGYAPLSFKEILEHVAQSKCIAEIVQGEASFPTTRYSEALVLKKNLVSNAEYFLTTKDKLPDNVVWFKNVSDIDFEKITKESDFDNCRYLEKLSITSMINRINEILEWR